MKTVNTVLSLDAFGKELKRQSRANLTRNKKNASRSLYESINYETVQHKNSFEFSFNMLPYGDFVDKGVSGTKRKFDTPYSYTNKMPPRDPILDWIKGKNIFLRNEKGQFKKGGQNTLAFLIQRKIFTKGMKPTHFYSKPFERLFKRLPDEVVKSYALDMQEFISFSRQNKRLK